jgi:hypothetical protein
VCCLSRPSPSRPVRRAQLLAELDVVALDKDLLDDHTNRVPLALSRLYSQGRVSPLARLVLPTHLTHDLEIAVANVMEACALVARIRDLAMRDNKARLALLLDPLPGGLVAPDLLNGSVGVLEQSHALLLCLDRGGLCACVKRLLQEVCAAEALDEVAALRVEEDDVLVPERADVVKVTVFERRRVVLGALGDELATWDIGSGEGLGQDRQVGDDGGRERLGEVARPARVLCSHGEEL